jgi:DNA-binding transcriptional MerR regulator
MSDYSIGGLSAATGCKVQTIRYYEQIKLMPAPPRTDGGQRRYAPAHVRRLSFIRHARELGFEIEAIRQLLAMSDHPERQCGGVNEIALQHVKDIDSKIERLSGLRKEMQRMIRSCRQGRIADCRIIHALAEV